MAHVRNLASALCGSLLTIAAAGATAATKVDEGFASRYEINGRFARPTNRIDEGAMGQHAYYWIQWRNHPTGRSTFRCQVTHESGATIVDEEITYADSPTDVFSMCGFTPLKDANREGRYTYTQYLDGAKVGEAMLSIETRYFAEWKLLPWKLALIAFAVAVLGLALLGRRHTHALGLKAR